MDPVKPIPPHWPQSAEQADPVPVPVPVPGGGDAGGGGGAVTVPELLTAWVADPEPPQPSTAITW